MWPFTVKPEPPAGNAFPGRTDENPAAASPSHNFTKTLPRLFLGLLLFCFAGSHGLSGQEIAGEISSDSVWKKWINEVDIIISSDERATAKSLKTTEERKRFIELFWKARDPQPETPENEYMAEFRRRVHYARERLSGERSDRGRIYILLGPPFDIERFSGSENLVDCEIWEYRTDGRHGLFPFMNILFFRQRDLGDYQLYHPGIHNATDLLNPLYSGQIRNPVQAYREIKQNSIQLADASLSIIPGEGEPGANMSLSSSNFALNKIYTLPEREAQTGYTRNFKIPGGKVEVSHTTNDIRGYSHFVATRSKGVDFISYALTPDVLSLHAEANGQYFADIQIDVKVEDGQGRLVYQNRRNIPIRVDLKRKEEIERRKVVFYNAEPIINGDFVVTAVYLNKTSQEFFSTQGRVRVSSGEPAALAGFSLRPLEKEQFMPYTDGEYLVFGDPRGIWSRRDTLEGVVLADSPPVVTLTLAEDSAPAIPVPVVQSGQAHRFSFSLAEVRDGKYRLTIRVGGAPPIEQTVHVLPFYINMEKPLPIVQPAPADERNRGNVTFVQAQQLLNIGDAAGATGLFGKIPENLLTPANIPVLARAYYLQRDYRRALDLLERPGVEKEYLNLVMLANSAIELKKYPQAVQYLEQLRRYGDTPELNRLLAAAWLSMGEAEKARLYYQKARELMNRDEARDNTDSPKPTVENPQITDLL